MAQSKTNFASDNYSGVHPSILEWIQRVNYDSAPAYGHDAVTQLALEKLKQEFGDQTEAFFVWNGTAANILSLKSALRPYHAILCSDVAHIHMDECGAPEQQIGSKLLPIPSKHGKISVTDLHLAFSRIGEQHAVQPRVISISQATEYGTVYGLEELKTLSDFAHRNGAFLHLDGARLANAAVSLSCSLKELTRDCGVDVLSFGGTKNGLLGAEAVVFLNPSLAGDFPFIRKQGLQLSSKMRFLSAQFLGYFSERLWQKNAAQANQMASLLSEQLQAFQPDIRVTQPVQANSVFAVLPKSLIEVLQKDFYFYVWNKELNEVRWMCSFDTTEEQVNYLVGAIRENI